MKKGIYILLIFFLLLSCDNKKHHELPKSDLEIGWGEKYMKELEDYLKLEKERVEAEKVNSTPASKKGSISSSSPLCDKDEAHHHAPDNMRGFDPPSEDDMNDNGMNRYMENNDEEGWY